MIGVRRANFRRRVTDRFSVKRNVVNRLGLKVPRGYGWMRNPGKYLYNKVYNRLSFRVTDLFK